MKPSTLGLLSLLGFLLCAPVLAADPPVTLAKFEPPDGVVYHGACISGEWGEADFKKALANYQTKVTDKPMALCSMFAHCMEMGHWNTWRWTKPTPDGNWGNGVGESIERIQAHGMVPVVAWTWMDWHQMAKSPRLQDLVAGKYDWYLDDWITGIKEYKDPIFIRLSHEMDGDWYPYSEGYKPDPKRNTTADYIAYWRYVVDRFRKAGVTNVAWVWCVNGDRSGGKDWPDYYPGDAYVDWLAVDIYNTRNPKDVFAQFTQMYGKTRKPIMIPEGGTIDDNIKWNNQWTNDAVWTKELFDVMDTTPPIKAFCWFEWDPTSYIERDAGQLAEYRKRIAEKRYVGKFEVPVTQPEGK
ncbi:MAG TPA: glycosyl hydrolase [Tepidisphaeraceae bacterium]|jgi:hypothetical protein|nr:glycosyl hydrolase [Tepidisphaeraceae bacterium]